MPGREEDALPIVQPGAVERPMAALSSPLVPALDPSPGQVTHPQVEPVVEEGTLLCGDELQEELPPRAHHGGGELPQAAEGPHQRAVLIHAVVDVEPVPAGAVARAEGVEGAGEQAVAVLTANVEQGGLGPGKRKDVLINDWYDVHFGKASSPIFIRYYGFA